MGSNVNYIEVTDPALIKELELGNQSGYKEVTGQDIISDLNRSLSSKGTPRGVTSEWQEEEYRKDPTAMEVISDTGRQIAETAIATGEVGASLVTGAVGGAAGLVGGIFGTQIMGDKWGKEFRELIGETYTYRPRSKAGKKALSKLEPLVGLMQKPREIATEYGGEQYGNLADISMLGLMAKAPAKIKSTAAAIKKAPQRAGEYLYNKTLQPSGTYADIKTITSTGFKGKFWVNEQGLKRFRKVKSTFDRSLNQIKAEYKGRKIPQDKILDPLEKDLMNYARHSESPVTNQRAAQRMLNQRRQVWAEDYPDGQIPFSEVQEFKQTLYKRYKNAFGETKKAMSAEGAKAFARSSKESLEQIAPELKKINPYEGELIQFYGEFDKALVKSRTEHLSINNTIINSNYLLTKLAKVFRRLSPDHIYANPKALRAYLKDIPNPPTVGYVIDKAAFELKNTQQKQLEYRPKLETPDRSGIVKETRNIPPLTKPTTKAIEYLPGEAPIRMGMSQESFVKSVQAKFKNPKFWSKNKDLTELRLKIKNREPIPEGEMNTLLYRIMFNIKPKKGYYTRETPPLKGSSPPINSFRSETGTYYTQNPRTGMWTAQSTLGGR